MATLALVFGGTAFLIVINGGLSTEWVLPTIGFMILIPIIARHDSS